ncbi:MAG TPA: YpdA family putative bacillithiol disulfide reductase [Vicinamibacterales bacterium]|nr:YpdA family putative bacillithiol disulfide reductase [Vicinamibacterales bacterium]
MHDVIVIGSGPVGLACAIEAQRVGLTARVIDKGALVNSIVGYPLRMEFFSTPELIEIGGYPFPVQRYKPTREDAIEYYRLVAAREALDICLYETVLDVQGAHGDFMVTTSKTGHRARHIVVATGFFDRPNPLNVPGEDLPKVTHYYSDVFRYLRQKVAVIGAKNSAAKAALDCYRHGIEVSLIVRSPQLSDSIKYWLKPDLANRIKEGSITALFNTSVAAIREKSLVLSTLDGEREIANDWVLAMTGYHPDFGFLERIGIGLADDADRTPTYDETTFQTNRPGVYIAGTVCGGYHTSRWFIENGRFHARQIAKHIAEGRAAPIDLEHVHWKTEE